MRKSILNVDVYSALPAFTCRLLRQEATLQQQCSPSWKCRQQLGKQTWVVTETADMTPCLTTTCDKKLQLFILR